MSITKACKIENCTNKLSLDKNGKRYLTKGYCKSHYSALRKYGNPCYSYYKTRPHIDCGDHIKIPTQRQGIYLILDKDFIYVDDRLWAVDSLGYPVSNKLRAHTMVMGKQPKGLDIDHINGDKLDNRRTNLRVITHAQNSVNTKLYKTNTSGFRGVWVDKKGREPKYIAQYSRYIEGKKKTFIIGSYTTAEEAGRARDKVAKEVYGYTASLNFPSDIIKA